MSVFGAGVDVYVAVGLVITLALVLAEGVFVFGVDRAVWARTSVIARVVLVCLNGNTVCVSLSVFVEVEIPAEVFVPSVFDRVKALVELSVNVRWTSVMTL